MWTLKTDKNNWAQELQQYLAEHTDFIEKNGGVDLDECGLPPEFRKMLREMLRELNLPKINAESREIRPVNSFYTRCGKRMLDILISSAALVITLPVNGILLVCTYFDVGSPVIFRQKRIGKDEKTFEIIKFRNMTNATDANGNLLPAKDRVTKFGTVVRKLSLDELMNFWSVFKGDMSIIGPRPLVPEYQDAMSKRHRARSLVRPGLECPNVRPGVRQSGWDEQFENDVYYVEHISLKTDVKMLMALVRMVFDRKSSSVRGNAHRGSFMGYDKNGVCINSMHVPLEYIKRLLEKAEDCEE